MALEAGQPAPGFDLPAAGGGRAPLADLQGRPLVPYFYPKDDIPGCTKEAQGFAEAFPEFQAAGIEVVGVSKDGTASHEKFKAKYDLPFTPASDESGAVVEAYGAWVEESMYGKKNLGTDRAEVLIDGYGKVRRVWRNLKVPGHVAELLEVACALR